MISRMIEEWKDIKEFKGRYQVSNLGQVRSFVINPTKPKILKQNTAIPYSRVTLYTETKPRYVYTHHLVLKTFNSTEDSTLWINHIDGDKRNNKLINLEWVTAKENSIHARDNGLMDYRHSKEFKEKHKQACKTAHVHRSHKVFCVTNGITYPSIRETARSLNLSYNDVWLYLKGKSVNPVKGFKFEYLKS